MVTGSMHLVEIGDYKLLLDCGLTFGNRPETRLQNCYFPFPPQDINAVILTHAHVDHCGNLPNLVRQGFTGPVYCTPPTRDLLALMLADSAKIQQDEASPPPNHIVDTGAEVARLGPLYTRPDVASTLGQCHAVPYDTTEVIRPGLRLRFVDAGHVLGSAMVHLSFDGKDGERSLTFTGDLGRRGLPFLNDPAPIPPADLLICESTYGGRTHSSLSSLADGLAEVVKRTIARGGKVLIPAFSLGRAQVVVYYLQQWMAEGRMPDVPIFVDSPLACDIAQVYKQHRTCLAERSLRWLEPTGNGHSVQYVRSMDESRVLSTRTDPCVIVASGGMCEAGRILHHLQHNIDDPRCSVILVSYQAPQSLGQRLMERSPTVRFDGKKWNKWAEVVDLNGFSGHADHNDFLNMLRPLAGHTKQVRLVHGDTTQATTLAKALLENGFDDVSIPRRGETVTLAG